MKHGEQSEGVGKRAAVTARMQAVARNGNKRKFVKVVFILPNTVHRSILLCTKVNVVLEQNVYIYKAFGKLAKMSGIFLFFFHCTLDLFIS